MFTLNELIEAFNAMETSRKYGISWSAVPVSEGLLEKYNALTAAEKEEFEDCLRLAVENLGGMGALESGEDLEWFHRELVSYFPSFDIQI